MKQIGEGVFFIRGQDEFIPDAHMYVLGKPSSGDLSILDVGLMGKGSYKIDSIQKLGLTLPDIKRVIMTHTHLDHIGCLREILEEIPNAELWVHTKEAEPLEEGDERTVYGMEMFKSMCQAQYGLKPGAFTFKVHRKLEGGETLEIGDIAWEVFHIPGHSQGSIALTIDRKRYSFQEMWFTQTMPLAVTTFMEPTDMSSKTPLRRLPNSR